MINRSILLSFIFVFGHTLSVQASQKSIVITDQHGKPLSDAIVEFVFDKTLSNQPTQANEVLIMDQADKNFLPEVLVVPTNSKVSFPNSDNIRHHVYSFSTPKVFELKLYAESPKEPLIFDKQGVVVLGCNIHDSMVGYLYISDSLHVYKSDENGVISVNKIPSATKKVFAWHPRLSLGVDERVSVDLEKFDVQSPISISLTVDAPPKRNTFEDVFR